MPVHQQRAVSRTFAYLGWTLGVCGAVAAALALDAAHDVTDGWFAAGVAASFVLLIAIVMGRDLFGLAPILLLCAAAGVLVFAAYTAHDVAWVLHEAASAPDAEAVERIAIDGAIALYLDLANLVLDVLRLLAEIAPFDL